MPVSFITGLSANCASAGCLCHDRRPVYPSDLTDAQWDLLRPEAEAVMAELTAADGRPMVHHPRAMLDAVFYQAKNGGEWRALPVDFPPYPAVERFFARWSRRGMPQSLAHRLRARLRVLDDRNVDPSAAAMDSQTVKAADTVGAGSRGYHAGKKINGRSRHVAVDVEGWLLAVVVTGAGVGDRDGARLLAVRLLGLFSTIKLIWADSGYNGPKTIGFFRRIGITLEIVKTSDLPGFHVVPRRWVVERTFGWLMRYRRLVRDYERRPDHHEAWVWWATIHLMTRRLARYQSDGVGTHDRWGEDRTRTREPLELQPAS